MFFFNCVTSSVFQNLIFLLQDGERGYLEGLASRYADLFSTHYGDVLSHLEDLRRAEWTTETERKPTTPGTPPPAARNSTESVPVSNHGLTTSQSQPIYVPGKYSVINGCLWIFGGGAQVGWFCFYKYSVSSDVRKKLACALCLLFMSAIPLDI